MTAIEWTDETWNPVRGCRRVSLGCGGANGEGGCYAEVQAERIVRMGKGKPTPYDGLVKLTANGPRWTGEIALDARRLAAPLRWREPRRVFVDSMSDLFFDNRPNEHIAAVFGVMAATPHITYQVLTKYAKRMREWFAWVQSPRGSSPDMVCQQAAYSMGVRVPLHAIKGTFKQYPWPLPNVWLGVSVENQHAADERIPDLLATQAAVRFISAEPLLGAVDLHAALWKQCADGFAWPSGEPRGVEYEASKLLHWIIAGCESGPGARECKVEWLRSLRDQCKAAEVPFFLKQARGSRGIEDADLVSITRGPGTHRKPGGIIGLPYLDGVQHTAMPGSKP